MFYLIYISSAVSLFSGKELSDLLEISRRNNHALGITGMLLYKDGNFMQFLEGPKDEVIALLEKIKKDPRHRGVMTLLQQENAEREFSDWAMGFKKLESQEVPASAGYSDFLNLPLNSERYMENPSKSLKLLMNFKRTMR